MTFEAGPYVYRGSAFTATANVIGAGGLSQAVTVTYSGDCLNVTSANGCTASATYPGDANHTASTNSKSITITKADAVIDVTPYSVTFDGFSHTATGTATGVLGANLSADLDLSGTTHTNAGTYTDGWIFTDSTGNYNDASGTVDDFIGLASSTTTVTFEAGPYVYRGSAFTATANVIGAGGLSQAVTVTYSGDCLNVTSANGCTASATYPGDANHTASTNSQSITITKRPDHGLCRGRHQGLRRHDEFVADAPHHLRHAGRFRHPELQPDL